MIIYVIGLCAALLLATGFVLQQRAASATGPEVRESPRLLLRLVRRPLWLAGMASMAAGQILGALALSQASLSLVEPLLASNLLFALALAALSQRRRLRPPEYLGALAIVLGLGGFVAAAGPGSPGDAKVGPVDWALAGGCLLATVATLYTVSRRRRPTIQAMLLAAAAGLLYGLQDALTQRALLQLGHGLGVLLASWQPWALVAVAIGGLFLEQRAFAVAPLSASLPALTFVEPICGIAIGSALFAQHLNLSGASLAAETVTLAIMLGGLILVGGSPLISGHHPGHRRRTDRRDASDGTEHPGSGEGQRLVRAAGSEPPWGTFRRHQARHEALEPAPMRLTRQRCRSGAAQPGSWPPLPTIPAQRRFP